MGRATVGISCHYHDSAVALVEDGRISFAIQEERLSRKKHDPRFPSMALHAALIHGGLEINDLARVMYHECPYTKFKRLFRQARAGWPRSWRFFSQEIPRFIHHKYPIRDQIRAHGFEGHIFHTTHHMAHAASTFFTSSFEDAVVITIDGVGESETTVVWHGRGNELKRVKSIHFPDSLGLLYSALTQYLGFRPNNGEYKVMGLASYGDPERFEHHILGNILHLHGDGSFHLDQRYFDWCDTDKHYTRALEQLFGFPPREPGSKIEQEHKDLAASAQRALEMALENLVAGELRFSSNVCLAGGVALNVVATAKLLRYLDIDLWIQPAAGDAGCALGTAIMGDMLGEWTHKSSPVRYELSPYLGLRWTSFLVDEATKKYDKIRTTPERIAELLASGKIVALYQGRDEWGNRALGNRTILADPRRAEMKDIVNARVKFREPFRPFAPVVLENKADRWFRRAPGGVRLDHWMMLTHEALRPADIPAVVHVNGKSRLQTIRRAQNPFYHDIVQAFARLTGVPILLNTSFNLRGEPIVCSPSDAIKTFEASGIDYLAFGDRYMIRRKK